MAFQVEQGEDGNLHIISTKPVAVKIIYKNRLSAGYTEVRKLLPMFLCSPSDWMT